LKSYTSSSKPPLLTTKNNVNINSLNAQNNSPAINSPTKINNAYVAIHNSLDSSQNTKNNTNKTIHNKNNITINTNKDLLNNESSVKNILSAPIIATKPPLLYSQNDFPKTSIPLSGNE